MVRYSSKVGDFVTESMHSYEHDGHLLALPGYDPTSCTPLTEEQRMVAVDPEGRAALVRLDSGNFALHRHGDDMETERRRVESLVLRAGMLDGRLRYVLDFVFLEGFHEPTLAVLYEPAQPSWPTHTAVHRDTVALAVITLNVEAARWTTISHQTGLPSECRRAVAAAGGVLLTGPNLFVHVDPSGTHCTTVLNNYAHLNSAGVPSTTREPLVYAHASLAVVDSGLAVWSSKAGAAYWLRFIKGARGLASMQYTPCEIRTDRRLFLSRWAAVDAGVLFAASLHGAHLVVSRQQAGPAAAKLADPDSLYGDDELDAVYTASPAAVAGGDVAPLSVLGQVPSVGPVADFCLGRVSEEEPAVFQVVACGGVGSLGHVTTLNTAIPLKQLTSFTLADAEAVHVLGAGDEERYLVVSTAVSSLLMRADAQGMREVEQTAFCVEARTIATALVGGSVVQVCPTECRVLGADTQAQVASIRLEKEAVQATICGQHVFCVYEDGMMQMLNLADSTLMTGDQHNVQHVSAVAAGDSILFSTLLRDGAVVIYRLDAAGVRAVFASPCLGHLPQVLVSGRQPPASAPRPLDGAVLMCSPGGASAFLVAYGAGAVAVYRADGDRLVKLMARPLAAAVRAVAAHGAGHLLTLEDGQVHLVMTSALGYPRIHRVGTGSARSAAMYSPHNLVLLGAGGEVSVHSVDPATVLDTDTPFTPHAFDRAVARIAYNSAGHCYAVVTTAPGRFAFPEDEYCAIADNQEWKPPPAVAADSLPPPVLPRPRVELLTPDGWSLIDEYALEPWDLVDACQACTLKTKETSQGRKPFFVVGVSAVKGEDRPVRGRILVFDVMRVVPDPERPQQTLKFKLLCAADMKAPVTAMSCIAGHLSVSTGYRTVIHQFVSNDTLDGVAFTDAGVHTAASCAVRHLLVLGDVGSRGMGLYGFQEAPAKLAELGCIAEAQEQEHPVLAVECMVAGQEMQIVNVDAGGRLSFYQYAPSNLASLGGTRLIHRGVYTVQGRVVAARRCAIDAAASGVLYMTADGALGLIRPVAGDDQALQRLTALQARMVSELPHPAGLHPRMQRGAPPNRQILDAALVRRFAGLPLLSRERLSADGPQCLAWMAQLLDIGYLL